MIVGFIIGWSHSGVDDIFLVDSKEEDQVPDSPEGDGNDGKDNSGEHSNSGSSLVSGEEVNHGASSNGTWDQKEEGNEDEPPWKVFVQKLEEGNSDQDD